MAEDTTVGGHDIHIDFHVTARGKIGHRVLSADEVRFDIGSGLSLYIRRADMDQLCTEWTAAKENLENEARVAADFSLT